MRDGTSRDYYRFREAQDLSFAHTAANPKVADIHRDMALRYADLIAREPVSRVVPVVAAPCLWARA